MSINIIKSIICIFVLGLIVPITTLMGHPTNERNRSSDVNSLLNNNPSAIRTIVIDAGHGGKDQGCSGSYTTEKVVALKIALKLGALIHYYHPEIEIVYTRKTDVFIPLFKRAEIANKHNADLFISIHCNAIAGGNARGTETFVMGLHTADENLEVAKRENASILLEDNYMDNYDGYDPNSPEGHIILSMMQNAYLDRSINFAEKIENSFQLRTGLKSRGVKQAGFVVLRKTTMPSVLVEAGFLSSQGDEHMLNTEEGQDKLAQALIKALTEYKRELDRDLAVQASLQNKARASAEANAPNKVISSNAVTEQRTTTIAQSTQPTRTTEQHTTPVQPNHSTEHTTAVNQVNIAPSTTGTDATSNTHVNSTNQANTQNSSSSQPTNRTPSPPTRRIVQDPIIYKVQIAAARNKPINDRRGKWTKVTDLEIKQEDDMYKYLTGTFYFMEEAEQLRSEMLKLGFKGAFIVGYQGKNRLKI